MNISPQDYHNKISNFNIPSNLLNETLSRSESLLTGDIHCIPVEQFLKNLHPEKMISEIV